MSFSLETEYKVPIVGNSNVGKTSIVTRYANDKFSGATLATVGVSNVQIPIEYSGNKVVVNIWDTAGQERFRSLVPLYTRGAYVIVIVFAVDDLASFEGLNQWYHKLRFDLGHTGPIIVCANKSDLDNVVLEDQMTNWALEHECQLIKTSAATGENIDRLFQSIAAAIIGRNPSSTEPGPFSPDLVYSHSSKCC